MSLYRKYRPQKFSQIIGQEHIKITLQNEIAMDKLSHAYLFSGPRGTGKTTTARLLAKALNCLDRNDKEAEPCDKCLNCREIREGRSLDVIEMDAASHTGVDNVRENIIENARFAPSKSKFKVFIIDEAHMLSVSAFNALLKTLEEPPSHVIFILATTEIHKLPATVVSRCERFDFKRANPQELQERLEYILKEEGIEAEKGVLESIVCQSEGCIRDAESLLGQILTLADAKNKKISLKLAELFIPRSNLSLVSDFARFLAEKKSKEALDLISRFTDEGIELNHFFNDLIEYFRKMLLLRLGSQSPDICDAREGVLQLPAEVVSLRDIVFILELLLRRKQEIKFSPIPQLPLELVVAEICNKS